VQFNYKAFPPPGPFDLNSNLELDRKLFEVSDILKIAKMDYLGPFFKKSYTTHRYHITNENDEYKEETFESDSSLLFYLPLYRYQWFSWLPWILTFFFAFLLLFFYGRAYSRISTSHLGSFEYGWETDFGTLKNKKRLFRCYIGFVDALLY
jgi:hypothetical protein